MCLCLSFSLSLTLSLFSLPPLPLCLWCRVEQQVQADGEQAPAKAEALVELGSVCCFQQSPALRCQTLVSILKTTLPYFPI